MPNGIGWVLFEIPTIRHYEMVGSPANTKRESLIVTI